MLLLAISAVAGPLGLAYAQMSEQAQQNMPKQTRENMPEQANEVLASLDNFGFEVSNFVHEALMQFQEQRQETISQIKQCREDMMNADPSERSQVRQDCRTSLDEIRNSYREVRGIFHDTFKEFRENIDVLRDDAKGKQVSDEDRQAAINDIQESAKTRHMQMQKGQSGMDVEQLREKMMSVHKDQQMQKQNEDKQTETMQSSYVETIGGIQVVTIHANEFKFIPSELQIHSGKTKFVLVNDGVGEHEMVAYEASKKDIVDQAELAEDEDTIAKNILFEVEEVHPGESGESEVIDLTEGSYVIGCHVPGHYEAGMKGTIEIKS